MPTERAVTVTAYTQAEAAKKLGLSRWTLRRDIASGKLVAHRSGKTVIIYSADLLDYVLTFRGGEGVPGA